MDTLEWVLACLTCLIVGWAVGEWRGERRLRAWQHLVADRTSARLTAVRQFVGENDAAYVRRVQGWFRGGPS